jgi:hypothetical protein
MAKTYSVKTGDTLISVAFSEGFRTWETIWNHPQNQALRETRPDPSLLYAGDELYIPDKTPKSISIKTFDSSSDQNQKYTFQVKSLKIYLSLTLEDENGDAYRNKQYQISGNSQISKALIKGQTDAKGFFSAALPPDTTIAELTLWKSDTDTAQTAIWQFSFGAVLPPDDNLNTNNVSTNNVDANTVGDISDDATEVVDGDTTGEDGKPAKSKSKRRNKP